MPELVDPQGSVQATSEKILEFNFQMTFILSVCNTECRNTFTLQISPLLCYFHLGQMKELVGKPQEKLILWQYRR